MKLTSKQNGSTLITSLVMLVVLTLLVVSAMRSSTINLRIAGNMQSQEEATAAAQQGIETIISSNFTTNPIASSVPVDINNDGSTDYIAAVSAPACIGSIPILNQNLNVTDPAELTCLLGSKTKLQNIVYASGTLGTADASLCVSQRWDVLSTATQNGATGNGVTVSVHQGVSLRVAANTICP